jgi:G3E family GTPase
METNINRTPVTLLTGFLGSGKTTLLKHILSGSHGLRIAIIENEFGEVSIDDELLSGSAKTVLKLDNGCLCCTSNGDLVQTLLDLDERRGEFDYIIIETTGVANPAPVVQTLLLNEDLAESFRLDAVVTLVDANHLPLHIQSKECVEQIALADIVILNKTDLVDEEALEKIEDIIAKKNKLARVHKTQRGAIELAKILNQSAFSETKMLAALELEADHDHQHEHTHGDHDCGSGTCNHVHHDHDHDHSHDHEPNHSLSRHSHDEDISSVGLVLAGSLDAGRFNAWFAKLIQDRGDSIFRIKGILSVADRADRVVVQTVHRVSEVTSGPSWGKEDRESKIVFIGKGLDRASLLQDLTSCLA